MTLLLFLKFNSPAFGCESKLLLNDIELYLEQSTEAFREMDETQAFLHLKSVGNSIGCMSETVSPKFSSQYFLMEGLVTWGKGNPEESIQYFAASKGISPDIQIDTSIFPAQHEIHVFFKVIQPFKETIEIEASGEEIYYFDGIQTNIRPLQRPTIFQKVLENEVIFTDILYSDEDINTEAKNEIESAALDLVIEDKISEVYLETVNTCQWGTINSLMVEKKHIIINGVPYFYRTPEEEIAFEDSLFRCAEHEAVIQFRIWRKQRKRTKLWAYTIVGIIYASPFFAVSAQLAKKRFISELED